MTRRYLALGDSYTIGEGVAQSERWPARLATLLRARGVDIFDPTIVARTGWTTSELRQAMSAIPPADRFDLVSLLVGVNDQYRGYDVDRYRRDFEHVLGRAIRMAGGAPSRVVVVSIPDWSVTPFAEGRDRQRIRAEIDRFNAVNASVAHDAGARRVDVTPSSREAGKDGGMLVADGLHPSAEMYQRWAELVLPVAAEALR